MMRNIALAAAAFLFILVAPAIQADPSAPLDLAKPEDWSWINEPWTTSDKPYIPIRQSIDALYRAKKMNDADLQRYKQAALDQREDAVARFKWAYYAFRYALLQSDISVGSGKLWGVDKEFRYRASPGAYQYTRLRFLVSCYLLDEGPQMAKLGERLLKRNPKDYLVMFYASSAIANGGDKEQDRALLYAKELVRHDPKSIAYQTNLAYMYERRWWGHHRPEDAQKAIAAYEKCLLLPGLSKTSTRQLKNTIQSLKGDLSKQKLKARKAS